MSIVLGRFPGNAASRGRAIRHTRYVLLSLTQYKTMLRMAHFSIMFKYKKRMAYCFRRASFKIFKENF